ncbi:uncharacterized protein LY89DRAFT_715568 [Mollisia scopiformis]|uniref:Flavin reductase like domain-containing protein n=1 Tax=Mollisia scopiformis TaxID=149040 RepID=A0A194XMI1_MOLSC|nr:uncharacterized protein LY89DRAFT_715568 [Mollisia scopiformis]KUJ21368.1 hypothetical protein LY89DRAFT_715568 [Mollisia scopiformis]
MQWAAATRFYGLFYRWSRAECLMTRRNLVRNLHSTKRSLSAKVAKDGSSEIRDIGEEEKNRVVSGQGALKTDKGARKWRRPQKMLTGHALLRKVKQEKMKSARLKKEVDNYQEQFMKEKREAGEDESKLDMIDIIAEFKRKEGVSRGELQQKMREKTKAKKLRRFKHEKKKAKRLPLHLQKRNRDKELLQNKEKQTPSLLEEESHQVMDHKLSTKSSLGDETTSSSILKTIDPPTEDGLQAEVYKSSHTSIPSPLAASLPPNVDQPEPQDQVSPEASMLASRADRDIQSHDPTAAFSTEGQPEVVPDDSAPRLPDEEIAAIDLQQQQFSEPSAAMPESQNLNGFRSEQQVHEDGMSTEEPGTHPTVPVSERDIVTTHPDPRLIDVSGEMAPRDVKHPATTIPEQLPLLSEQREPLRAKGNIALEKSRSGDLPDKARQDESQLEKSAPEQTKDPTDKKSGSSKISTHLRSVMRALPASVVVITTALTTSASDTQRSRGRAISPALAANARGMTVSSFTTVSLDPHPIIQFNIKVPSRTLGALMETRHFFVHILEATMLGAKIAAAFTKGNSPDGNPFVNPVSEEYKVRPTPVDVWKRVTETDDTYIRPSGWQKRLEEDFAWVPDPDNSSFKRPATFSNADVWQRKPISFDSPKSKTSKGHRIILPRIASDGVLRTLRCKVLDKGARGGGRGDGFIRVGDHVIVIAQVHTIVSHRPPEEVSKSNKKALAYAHGNFTATNHTIDPNTTVAGSSPRRTKDRELLELLQSNKAPPEHLLNATTEHGTEAVQDEKETKSKSKIKDHLDESQLLPDQTSNVPIETLPDEEDLVDGGVPLRKIRMKGLSLREINELAERYSDRAHILRTRLGLSPASAEEEASIQEPPTFNPTDDVGEAGDEGPEHPAFSPGVGVDGAWTGHWGRKPDNPKTPKPPGPRIIKHVSNRGASLEDIRQEQQISSEVQVPRRIAQAAIEALPDADAETRKSYALFRAAEELTARREEIEIMRTASKSRAPPGSLRSGAKPSSKSRSDEWSRKQKQGSVDQPVNIKKYEIDSRGLDPELRPKMDAVWEKVQRFKTMRTGLRVADDEQYGLFWRPKHIVKEENKEKARMELEMQKCGSLEESRVEWRVFEGKPPAEELILEPEERYHNSGSRSIFTKLGDVERDDAVDTGSYERGRTNTGKQTKQKEKTIVYQEADPFADEFL